MHVYKCNPYLELARLIEEDPYTPTIWERVLYVAQGEEGTPKANEGFYGSIPLPMIIEVGETIRKATSLEEIYRILSENCPRGEPWYNIILGVANQCSLNALESGIKRGKWKRALDVGCGTGDSICVIAKYCEVIHGLDVFPFLLEVARIRSDFPKNAKLSVGNAISLPFPDRSFDLVYSHGLTLYLGEQEQIRFCNEVIRVLALGGCYFVVLQSRKKEEILLPAEKALLINAKALLVHLIDSFITKKYRRDGPIFPLYKSTFLAKGFQLFKEDFWAPVDNKDSTQREIILAFRKTRL